MKRRTIVIIALLSALFSLVYLILGYYGIIRYFDMHMFSPESYTKSYPKLDKADKGRVVISLTTTPDRLKKLKPTINSLLDQTVRVDEIAVSVPYGKDYDVPKYIKDVAQVYRYSVKYGDNGKLIPIMLREGEEDTKIILVDDNMVYGKDFIEDIVAASNKEPNKAIGMKKLCSKYGVLVKPKFFKEDVIEYDMKSPCDKWLKDRLKVPHKIVKYSETFQRL